MSTILTRLYPRTLYLRMVAAWFLIMFLAHIAYVTATHFGHNAYATSRTSYYLAKDIGLLLPALERTAPQQRSAELARMQRNDYVFEIAAAHPPTRAADNNREADLLRQVGAELGPGYKLELSDGGDGEVLLLHTRLKDQGIVTARLLQTQNPMNNWGFISFLLQIVGVLAVTAVAARQATLPLSRLTAAAETLGTSMQCEPIAEDGPVEVARAAAAFNAMGRRIKDHLAERVRILAAISHDLQTPITRMRLRADLLENGSLKAKFDSDLDAMQVLVEEGIAYARSTGQVREQACRVDLDAMLDALAGDYADSGQQVAVACPPGLVVQTWPHTVRRILVNLTDNALKFGDEVAIECAQASGQLRICVRDRGPGIEAEKLEAVFQPFYRLEASRNRATGGAGLGLAIARQLTLGMGGTLTLANREGGGLEASLVIPTVS